MDVLWNQNSKGYLMEISRLINDDKNISPKEKFAMDVLEGLCASPKTISAKYFYDDIGSELFQKITHHEDYYPTRTEFEILHKLKDKIPNLISGEEIDIIELGAGDCHKSQLIIQGFLDSGYKVNFYPIDISEKAMALLESILKPHERLNIHGVVAEYLDGLRFVRKMSSNKQLVLFLGSNIGNFDRVQNQGFLRKLWNSLNTSDYVLVGFDLKKNVHTLTDAYNDSDGLTKEFNINLLRRINTELGGNFDLSKFQHFGVYNPVLGAMESYLLSTEAQEVYISEVERSFHFDAFEALHLEYSFKFLKSDIDFLSKQTGFEVIEHFSDAKNYFVDSLWKVKKENLNERKNYKR
jgi:L-histidine N-alpha-methyltransferase